MSTCRPWETQTLTYAGISAASGSTWGPWTLCWSRWADCFRTEWILCYRCTGWLTSRWNGDLTAPACCALPFQGQRKTTLSRQTGKKGLVGYYQPTFTFYAASRQKDCQTFTQHQQTLHFTLMFTNTVLSEVKMYDWWVDKLRRGRFIRHNQPIRHYNKTQGRDHVFPHASLVKININMYILSVCKVLLHWYF